MAVAQHFCYVDMKHLNSSYTVLHACLHVICHLAIIAAKELVVVTVDIPDLIYMHMFIHRPPNLLTHACHPATPFHECFAGLAPQG